MSKIYLLFILFVLFIKCDSNPGIIESILNKLASEPDIGRKREEVYPNARSFVIEKHVVFYQRCEDGIEVARILHQRMDPLKHF